VDDLRQSLHCASAFAIVWVLAIFVVGCGNSARTPLSRGGQLDTFIVSGNAASPSPRYIAEQRKIEIITSGAQLQKSWNSAIAFCGTIQCEVVSSSITAKTFGAAPSGDVGLRVSPEALNKLLAYVETLGTVGEYTTNREDKTNDVVDTEAKIKNLTAFRDNLRAMLARPSATVKDVLEIQRQLTDTQSELDGETAERKILANETERIAVEISFVVERPAAITTGAAEIRNAFRESGDILADSTASLITTVVTVVPWLILIIPCIWLLLKAWRALRARGAKPSM
jgi:hypothetical protein